MLLRFTCIKTAGLLAGWLLVAGFLVATPDLLAQGLSLQQRILMPGPLTENHSEYEAECENCHSPFERQEMAVLCLVCHEEVAEDRLTSRGFHGQNSLAASNSCESCHADHEGRDFDITGLLPDTFDHDETRFLIEGAHTELSCENCHESQDPQSFRGLATDCSGCHSEQDIHAGALGESCDSCHQSQSWQQLLEFDHDATDFVLAGSHIEVACTGCHLGQRYEFDETSCVTCHGVNDVHGDAYGDNCDGCHTVEGWEEVTFNHEETGFPLDGAHENTECVSCHSQDQLRDSTVSDSLLNNRPTDPLAVLTTAGAAFAVTESAETRTCTDCHRDDDLHFGRNGSQCADCHSTAGWQEPTFEHNLDTDYLLTDAHAEAECTQCHTGALADPLAQECVSCHLADDVHQDPAMQGCESCHSLVGWDSTQSFDHEFTSFPLLGMHQIAPCESCHVDSQLSSAETECVSCHGDDDFHQRSVGEACNDCHTPNAWEIWQFDHTMQTDFELAGSHDGLACESCHLADTLPADTPDQCGTCHLQEDVHRGQFGQACEQCHTTTDFSEVIITGRRL